MTLDSGISTDIPSGPKLLIFAVLSIGLKGPSAPKRKLKGPSRQSEPCRHSQRLWSDTRLGNLHLVSLRHLNLPYHPNPSHHLRPCPL